MKAGGRKRRSEKRLTMLPVPVEEEWEVRERERANRMPEEKKEGENMGGERRRGGEERRGTVTVLSPVTHTDVRGGEREREEDCSENRGAEKVTETASEEETKERREASNTERNRSGDRAQDKGGE